MSQCENKQKRTSNFTAEEVNVLVTTIKDNFDVLYGQFSKKLSNKEARRQAWHRVLDEVNLVSQETRSLSQVKNKWKKCKDLYNREPSCPYFSEDCDEIDSMPLQQRIEARNEQQQQQEPVLQSQPLSPTKLKVTRQAAKPQIPSKPPTPEPPNDEVCLKWNSHYQNLQSAFPALLNSEKYSDATLVSEGKTLKCHRVILSSCSTYFEEVLKDIAPFQHPVLFMKDTPFWILKALCDFMYAGEVHIFQNMLEELLKVADILQIKGLAGKPTEKENIKAISQPIIKQEAPKPKEEEKETIKEEKKVEFRPDRPKRHQIKEEPLKLPPKPSRTSSPSKSQQIPSKSPPIPSKSHHVPTKSQQIPTRSHQAPPKQNTTAKNAQNVKPSVQTRRLDRKREKKSEKDVTDPLDLLEPVYEEEVKKEPPPPQLQKVRDLRNMVVARQPINKSVRRSLPRRIRKRRYVEDRDESPPPMFTSRKGTRSRPNVKVPKYFHSSFDNSEISTSKESDEATIVWEPHTSGNVNLPMIQFEEIKAEPIDIEDVPVEMEENMENFGEEEIIGNYDSPIVNLKEKSGKNLAPPPVIMDVCTVGGESREGNTLKIVDISQIGARKEILDSEILPQQSKGGEQDPLNLPVEKSPNENAVLETEIETEIIISNVETVKENQILEKTKEVVVETAVLESGNLLGFHIESIVGKFVEESQEGLDVSNKAKEHVQKSSDHGKETSEPDSVAESDSKHEENDKELMENERVESTSELIQTEETSDKNEGSEEIQMEVKIPLDANEEPIEEEEEENSQLMEDEFEKSLLAESSGKQQEEETGDQSEKTLEMIVNDLNESLGRDMKEKDTSPNTEESSM